MYYGQGGVLSTINPETGLTLQEQLDWLTLYHTVKGRPYPKPYPPYNEPPQVSMELIEDCPYQKSICQGHKPVSGMVVGGPKLMAAYRIARRTTNEGKLRRNQDTAFKSKYPMLHNVLRMEAQLDIGGVGNRYGGNPQFLNYVLNVNDRGQGLKYKDKSSKQIAKLFHQIFQEIKYLQWYYNNVSKVNKFQYKRANLKKLQVALAALYDQKRQTENRERADKQAIAQGYQNAADAQALREVEKEHYFNLYGVSDPIEILAYKKIEKRKYGKTSYEALLAGETFQLPASDQDEVMEITATKKEEIIESQENRKKIINRSLVVGGAAVLLGFLFYRRR